MMMSSSIVIGSNKFIDYTQAVTRTNGLALYRFPNPCVYPTMPAIESMHSNSLPILTSFDLSLINVFLIYLSCLTGIYSLIYEFYMAFAFLSAIFIFQYNFIGRVLAKKFGDNYFMLRQTSFNFDQSAVKLFFSFQICNFLLFQKYFLLMQKAADPLWFRKWDWIRSNLDIILQQRYNIQIQVTMKCICEWLCPKRKKNDVPYDVHQQTFEMDQNIGDLQEPEKLSTDPTIRSTDVAEKQESNESLTSTMKTQLKPRNSQEDQRKFIQNKNRIQEQTSQLKQQKQEPKKQEQQKPVEEKPKPKYNIMPSSVKKKKFNPQDYYFKQEENQFRVKTIDSIKGQQFNIDGCKNGTYFIFDITANIYIDDCQDCFVFAAPVQSSIFVRNCKNMTIVGAVGQFRTYNCHNSHFSIYCKSQPVIQSSSGIHFSSLHCPEYPQLRKQFQQAKLQPWNSNWSQIHNFTPKQDEKHYQLDKQPHYNLAIDWERAYKQANIEMSKKEQQIVPFIQGALPIQEQVNKILIVFGQQASQNDQKIGEWIKQNNLHLLRASKTKVGGDKHFTIALLINKSDFESLDLSQLGDPTVITQKQQVQQKQPKYFVNFKDER